MKIFPRTVYVHIIITVSSSLYDELAVHLCDTAEGKRQVLKTKPNLSNGYSSAVVYRF